MTVRAADKILLGLQEALSGGSSRATFYGMKWDNREHHMIVSCPRCTTGHRFRTREPRRCRNCGLSFRFTANEAMPATLGEGCKRESKKLTGLITKAGEKSRGFQ
jgi:hypothetical protein